MNDAFLIFVDGAPVPATRGQSALDAIAASKGEVAEQLRSGARVLTDSRGLPAPNETPAYAGAIFRVVSNRAARAPHADEEA